MSDDWVRMYRDKLNTRRTEEEAGSGRGKWAEQEALGVFHQLCGRLKRDIHTFQTIDRDHALAYAELPSGRVRIRRALYPAVTLDVELRGVTIHCFYTFRRDETCQEEESDPRLLRIAANDEGVVQLYKNGNPFADVSDVSESLLTPLFDYITRIVS